MLLLKMDANVNIDAIGSKTVCLKQENREKSLLHQFLANETLPDVTLSCDGFELKAHKIILSTCSPVLKSILSKHYSKHSVVIMSDVKYADLKLIIDYMYQPEIEVPRNQLSKFLEAAEFLKLKVTRKVTENSQIVAQKLMQNNPNQPEVNCKKQHHLRKQRKPCKVIYSDISAEDDLQLYFSEAMSGKESHSQTEVLSHSSASNELFINTPKNTQTDAEEARSGDDNETHKEDESTETPEFQDGNLQQSTENLPRKTSNIPEIIETLPKCLDACYNKNFTPELPNYADQRNFHKDGEKSSNVFPTMESNNDSNQNMCLLTEIKEEEDDQTYHFGKLQIATKRQSLSLSPWESSQPTVIYIDDEESE